MAGHTAQRPRVKWFWLSIAIGLAGTALADPPKVIKAVPDNGDTGVDPGLEFLRVEFDQDMQQGGYSWCGGGDSFPEGRGRPRWESPRVCVFPVQLKPNHQYHLSINCPAAQNFRGVSGEPAEIYPISFRTAGGEARAEAKAVDPATQRESAKALRRVVDQHYSYRELRDVDWDEVFEEYAPRLEAAESGADFARLAGELLAKAKDIHIWLEYDGVRFAAHRRAVPPNCNPQRLAVIVPEYQRHNDCVASGRFPDGIGYIAIDSWSNSCEESLKSAYDALWTLRDCQGLIIDVRRNSGGDEPLAQGFAGCFVDRPTVYAKHVYRDHSAPGGFTKPHERVVERNESRPKYNGQVAVLIGRHVMSSCEAFVLMMKQVRGCKLFGEPTYGSSGNPKSHELPNGVVVYLPSWKSMTPEGKTFEGEGIKPDVEVRAKPSDFAQDDPVLEAALKWLRAGERETTKRPYSKPAD